MQNNLNEKEQRSLSRSARDMVANLERQIRETLKRDVNREPKLSDEEKAEVAQLTERIEYLRPVCDRLVEQLEAAEAREKHFTRNMTSMIIAGEDVSVLVAEQVLIKPVIVALSQASHDALLESSAAESKILKIKDIAREREAQNER